jgi:hypothetical protein
LSYWADAVVQAAVSHAAITTAIFMGAQTR